MCKTLWIASCMLVIVSLSASAQRALIKGIEFIPFSKPPLENGRDVANWEYKSTCFVTIDENSKIVGRIYDDLQCTKYDVFNKREFSELAPYVYLKAKIPNSTDLLSAVSYGGATDLATDVLFTIDTQGNVKDTLEVIVANSGLAIKAYRIMADFKIVVSRLVVTSPQEPVIIVDFMPNTRTIKGYREDTYYHIDGNSHFVKDKTEKFPEKTYSRKQLEDLNAWEL